MKLNHYFIYIFLILLASCSSSKEANTDKFFDKWEKESENLINKTSLKGFEDDINQITSLELCENSNHENFKNFPKLKYSIVQENINISLVENLKGFVTKRSFETKFIYEDSIYKNHLKCNNNHLKSLVLTEVYKKQINGKLKYGFGSLANKKNSENARALLESHHTSNYYTLPYKIERINFNKRIDSSFVESASTYHGYGKLYVKENNSWKLVKEIYHLVE